MCFNCSGYIRLSPDFNGDIIVRLSSPIFFMLGKLKKKKVNPKILFDQKASISSGSGSGSSSA